MKLIISVGISIIAGLMWKYGYDYLVVTFVISMAVLEYYDYYNN